MIIANGFGEIFDTLDFTDSIVEQISWENDLLDLVLTVDYYFDSGECNLLKIRFKDCLKADFLLTDNLLSIQEEEKRSYSMSWYTIQNYRLVKDSDFIKKCNRPDLLHIEIYTVDQEVPWLSIVSKGVTVEKFSE
ncbi:hypothetical protein EV586_1097 [Tumebacillus sp. BK434]|uniref:hypothetical protein n=1 Tax=Tumebacillus sp. BK434 TaxID=2512169 RepID=UPI00104D17A6|nr:hypothetical protein [Tumebacillus sp. BK434]TCP52526.1 hypothetical protein EV586_1097 [Tumebacillus sp. BK434]